MVILWQQQIRMEVDSSEVEKSDIDADTEVSWDMFKIIYYLRATNLKLLSEKNNFEIGWGCNEKWFEKILLRASDQPAGGCRGRGVSGPRCRGPAQVRAEPWDTLDTCSYTRMLQRPRGEQQPRGGGGQRVSVAEVEHQHQPQPRQPGQRRQSHQ